MVACVGWVVGSWLCVFLVRSLCVCIVCVLRAVVLGVAASRFARSASRRLLVLLRRRSFPFVASLFSSFVRPLRRGFARRSHRERAMVGAMVVAGPSAWASNRCVCWVSVAWRVWVPCNGNVLVSPTGARCACLWVST